MKYKILLLLTTMIILLSSCSSEDVLKLSILPGDRASFGEISYNIPSGYSLSDSDAKRVVYEEGNKKITIDRLEKHDASEGGIPKTVGDIDGWYEETRSAGQSPVYHFELFSDDSLYRISTKNKEDFWDILGSLEEGGAA